MTNVQRAKLLYDLFPSEIPAFLDYTLQLCIVISEDANNLKEKWDNTAISFPLWLELVNNTATHIQRHGIKVSAYVFSEQFFDGTGAIYMSHSLMLYTKVRQHPNRQFVKTADLLFTLTDTTPNK